MVKGFRIKGLASIMLAGVFCFCAAVPVLAAGTVRSLNLRFEDQYELGAVSYTHLLCSRTSEDMMKVRNLGRKSLEEVLAKLKELGLQLNSSDEQ